MKPTIAREWFERWVQLEEGLDVTAGLPPPDALQGSASQRSEESNAHQVRGQKWVGASRSPKVLVSYSHDSPEHENQVLALADHLRAAGVDANIDQYESHPAEGWPLWMDRQIRGADHVLVVCTEAYARRVAREEKPGVGLGATWEGNLIYQHLYNSGLRNDKFIPVVFAMADREHIPLPLQGVTSYLVGAAKGYSDLYRRLTGQPEIPRPPLGRIEQMPPKQRQHTGPLPDLLPQATGGQLSYADRLDLIRRLNALPSVQLDVIVFTLNPPPGLVPPDTAAQGSRVSALLTWAEGAGGCGLLTVHSALETILNPSQPPAAASEPAATPKGRWLVPYPRNPYFTGRTRVLSQLRKTLTSCATAGYPQAITGLGGVGKSQIAVEYAYRYRDTYSSGVFWARAESAVALHADFRAIARELDLREKDAASAETTREAVNQWLSEATDYLLILDNVEDPESVALFLPPAPMGHVLITSRKRNLDRLNVATPTDLTVMDSDEAVAFLLGRVSRPNVVPSENLAAIELAQELGCLPLALEQAGAFIAVHDCRFANYLTECRTALLAVLDEQSPVAGGVAAERHEIRQRATVRTTWERSFRAVREQSPASAELLTACSFFDPDYIPEDLLVAASSELGETLERALSEAATSTLAMDRLLRPLVEHSLIRRARDVRTFDIHRLVQAVVKAELSEADLQLWIERVVRALARTYPGPEFKSRALCDLWLSHALAVAPKIISHKLAFAEAVSVLGQAGFHLQHQAQYPLAIVLYQGALSILMEECEPGYPQVSVAFNNLASAYRAQGQLDEAETIAEQALAITEAAHGPDHPEVGMAGSNLACIYQERGRISEAVALQERALRIMERQRGPEHADTAKALNNLADAYRAQGRIAQAEALFRRALAIRQKILDPNDPEMAISLDNLAMVCQAQGDLASAESLHQQALATAQRSVAPDHPLLATILNNVALLYHEQARYAEARPLFERSLAIRKQTLGDDHPDMVSILYNFAGLHAAVGEHAEALVLLKKALEVADRSLGLDHPTTRFLRVQWEEVRTALADRENSTEVGSRGP